MCGSRLAWTITAIVLFLVFALPLGIASIAISQNMSDQCNHRDPVLNLDIREYLLGSGIASVCTAGFMALFGFLSIRLDHFSLIPIVVTYVTYATFGFAWLIIGGILLFRYNFDCINEGSVAVTYALAIWILKAATFLVA